MVFIFLISKPIRKKYNIYYYFFLIFYLFNIYLVLLHEMLMKNILIRIHVSLFSVICELFANKLTTALICIDFPLFCQFVF